MQYHDVKTNSMIILVKIPLVLFSCADLLDEQEFGEVYAFDETMSNPAIELGLMVSRRNKMDIPDLALNFQLVLHF